MDRSRSVAACLLAAAIVACTPTISAPTSPMEPWETGSELTTSLGWEPDTIDPQRASFQNEASVVGMVYEPLLTYDPVTLRLVPAAARSLPEISSDGLTYTYRLHSGLTYSDGSPLTAHAFAFAFIRLCDPRTHGQHTFVAYAIAGCEAWNALPPLGTPAAKLEQARADLGVRALDDRTLEFRLREPAPQFPHATALWIGAPIRETDFAGRGPFDHPTPETYIGNGPFKLVEWKRNEKMVFERNERYRTSVRLKRWTKVFSSDAGVMRAAYDEGRLDAVAVGPANEEDRERMLLRPDLVRRLGTCTSYIAFNTQRPPFDDPLVRLAFAKALDREELVRTVEMTGRAAASFVPHDQPGHAHDDRVQSFDPAEARALLAASRYGRPVDGRIGGIDLAFTFTANARSKARVKWATDDWLGYLGVRVQPDPVSGHWSYGLLKRPQALPQLSLMGWCADYPDAQDWFSAVFHSRARNRSGFANTAFDAIVDRADRERDPAAREALYEGASYVLSRAAPAAYLTWSENWTLVRPDVRGYRVSAFDWDFAQFSLATIYRATN
jgi:oligopeptide transport system substrate-binding protein